MEGVNGIETKKGCLSCFHLQYEPVLHEYPLEGGYFYCDKRDDEPEEKFKTWPAKRKLKCFKRLLTKMYVAHWREK